jgi:hypothetical protein
MSVNDLAERNAAIVAAWLDGSSSGQIASRFGVTRNVVMGVVHREKSRVIRAGGEFKSSREIEKQERTPRPRQSKVVEATAPVAVAAAGVVAVIAKRAVAPAPIRLDLSGGGRWVPLLETKTHSCRWSDDGRLFCNAEGHPWCDEHHRRAYTPYHRKHAA